MKVRSVRARRVAASLRVAVAAVCAAMAAGTSATTIVANSISQTRVLLPQGVYAPGEPGVALLHDYGPFALYRVDGRHAAELSLLGRDAPQPLPNRIQFSAEPLDTSHADDVQIPAALQAVKPAGSGLQVVQFAGPIAPEWYAALEATGVRVLQYIPDYAYVVRADDAAVSALVKLVQSGGPVQYTGPYAPYFKLDARLGARARAGFDPTREIDVVVQVVGGIDNKAVKQAVLAHAKGRPEVAWDDLRGFEAVHIRIDESAIADIARLDDVYAIEESLPKRKLDERQDLLIVGNFNANQSQPGPVGTGYVAWLTNLGFPTTPASYPQVDIADDGVGNGVASSAAGDQMLRLNGSAAGASRLLVVNNCTSSPSGDGKGGHGHLNTTIVAGYDARAGFPYVDPLGYLRGVGTAPFNNVSHTKIFSDAGSFSLTNCSGTTTGLIKREQNTGTVISSNSWGASNGGQYDSDARAYDIGTRDADASAAGDQPMVFVFAAGNAGPGASTVGSPGSAKNVITVGASENYRPSDEDGAWSTDGACPGTQSDADNAMDVAGFSSRGPASASRKKPEVIAPGTHIQGSASTNGAAYAGDSVCIKYKPSGQTVFAASTGTSHSTPAVSGVASLVAYYLKSHFQAGNPNYATAGTWPSAAAIKAYLMAHTTYLTGVSANDNLPSNNQGYGMPNLTRAFDATTARSVLDQQTILSATGQTYTWTGSIPDPTKPFRVALAFSDAPGNTSGSPVVNNLDLTVTVGANTYKGNVFTGQYSVTGGSADALNAYEAVFLPAGTTGSVTITVTAANIAGDAVPSHTGNDQDFALVCSNCSQTPDFSVTVAPPTSVQACAGTPVSFTAQLTALNGFTGTVTMSAGGLPANAGASFAPPSLVPSGNSVATITTAGVASGTYPIDLIGTTGALTHPATATLYVSSAIPAAASLGAPANHAYGVASTPALSWSAVPGALDYTVEIDDDPAFGSVNYSATVSGTSHTVAAALNPNTHYYWRVRAGNGCGGTLSAVYDFVTYVGACQTIASTDVPKNIPDKSGSTIGTVNSTLTSALSGNVKDVDVVNLTGTHTWINDLDFALKSPNSTSVAIMARSCNSEDNFNLSLDDAAAGAAGGWPCPPVNAAPYPANSYRPSNPLSAFSGGPANGTWTLTAHDNVASDTGTIAGWGLRICTESAATLIDAVDDTYAGGENTTLSVSAPGVLDNDAPNTGLTTSNASTPSHGSVTLNANGSFVYQPAQNYCGADSFTYQAGNGSGSDTATVHLDVTCANQPPAVVNDSYSGFENTAIHVSAPGVLSNDTDVEHDALTAAVVATTAHGSLSLLSSGAFDYTPANGWCGVDTFTYKANDGFHDSAVATASITLACDNVAPVAVADAIRVNQGATATTLVGGASSVLANDTDGDSDPLTAVLVTPPTRGTLTLNPNGTFSYQHGGTGPATDSFTYKAHDGLVDSAPVTVNISINRRPVAGCTLSKQLLLEGQSVNIDLSAMFTDPDADALSYSATGLPGGLAVNPAGILSGTVSAGAVTNSPYAPALTATDPEGASQVRTLGFDVINASDLVFRTTFEAPADAAACH